MIRRVAIFGLLVGCGQPVPVAPPAPRAVELAPGTYIFDLELRTKSDADPSALTEDRHSARLAVDASLEVAVSAKGPEQTRLRLESVEELIVELGEDVRTGSPATTACTAWADLSDGPPAALRLAPDADPLCRAVMTHVALAIDLRREGGEAGRPVLTSYGPMHATYTGSVGTITREAAGTTATGLQGRAHGLVEGDADGRIVDLRARQWLNPVGDEARVVAATTVALHRTDVSANVPPPPAEGLEVVDLLPAVDGTEQREAEARGYADGLDRGMLGLYLAHIERGGSLRRGFAIEARGLMIAEPGLAHEVAAAFGHVRGTNTRALIADLLAQAPTAEAQAELRAIMRRVVAEQADDRAGLLQRLGLLDAPDEASAALALELHNAATRSGDDLARRALLHVIGILGRRVPSAQAQSARRLERELQAEDPAILRAALAGLGNLADPARLDLIVAQLDAADPLVRADATVALRRMPPALTVPLLHLLAHDPSPYVADAAKTALSQS